MGKVIILGAGGFIGRDVSRFFLEKVGAVELYSRHSDSICGTPIKKMDLTRNLSLRELLRQKKVKAMIYLSSLIPETFDAANWHEFLSNLKMHKSVLEAWRNLKCHLIYASSCSVYQQNKIIPWRETDVVMPDNYYSLSKLTGELMFLQVAQKENLPLTILRLNSPYKVGAEKKRVINIFIQNALSGKNIQLYGSGKRNQDFMYMPDVVRAFWSAYKKKVYGIFNIATGKTVTMKKLAQRIIKISRSSSKIVYLGKPDIQEHVKVKIDTLKARKYLNFLPAFSLDQGIKECVHQHREMFCENRDNR